MTDGLSLERKEQDDSLIVTFKGAIDENAILGRIFETDKRKIRINLSKIERINSCGVREWVNAVKEIPANKQLEFEECSGPIVKQFNMITNFGSHGKITSFLAPYFCAKCKKNVEKLIVVAEHLEKLLNFVAPQFSCTECGSALEFDDLEEKYFQFISRQESML